jgi:heterodisulfide reductase subunit A
METPTDAVLVVGAGIAGMAAGMHLAEVGHPVYLLDAAPVIGGSMHLLDHTFPTNSCGLCLMLPRQPATCPTFECDLHAKITLLPYAELTALAGEPGHYTATVHHKARYVDPGACTGCGACAAVCPEARPHDHEGWLSPEKAIYRPAGLRVVPDTWVIDMAYCTRCGACVAACPTGAVDLAMEGRAERLPVGAVLLTPGFAAFDARGKGEYGYGVYDNVLSALEFERMVSLAGSSVARLARPSDHRPPRKIAFVHCVGSRDNLCGAGHCSSACCMYTAKQVALAKQIEPDLEATVFFMDLRAFGKDFEAYMAGVQALPGVTYRRAMPSAVYQQQQTRDLQVAYVGEDGRLGEETFDLLVLAVGLAPPTGMQALAQELGVALNEYGFAQTDGYRPLETAREGVFVAGAFREPKDIPETVAEAAGAAADVAAFLQAPGAPWHRAPEPQAAVPERRDVSDEEPRVGVFVCACDGGPPGSPGRGLAPLGVPELVAWAAGQPEVALAQAVPDACSETGRAAIRAAIEGAGLNRVVVAGCSPRLYADAFDGLMQAVGLDPRLLTRVNLREQVVYPHRSWGGEPGDNGAGLLPKAQSLVGMAVAGLRTMRGVKELQAQPVYPDRVPAGVVVGGGAAGLTAARTLAALGIPVHLVERETELGGQWRHIRHQPDGSDPQAALEALRAQVEGDPRITLHLGAELGAMGGTPGAYRSVLVADGDETEVEHGALVVATGGGPAPTEEYLYGQHRRVVTQRELEQMLAARSPDLDACHTVVMIQCVGSREPQRPYCSRVCCTQAVKNALALKAQRPERNVYVLYREVRTYGVREAYYQAARDAGVVFLRYELPDVPGGTGKPQVSAAPARGDGTEGGLRIRLREPVTGQAMALEADLLVLSVGVNPSEEQALAQAVGVGRNGDGFFQEEHPKMKPLDLGKAGVYVAGLAHSPRFLDETIAQAQGAAMRAAAFLAAEGVAAQATSVWVNPRLCSFCGLCVEACPYAARVLNPDTRVADVEYALCQGCGVCAVVCPNKATLQKTFEHGQVMAMLDAAL